MTGGRLLEVGCAYGFFLEEAKGFFDHRAGTDYSPGALAKARGGRPPPAGRHRTDRPGGALRLYRLHPRRSSTSTIRSASCAPGRPPAAGGVVVLATPDMGSFWRPLLRSRWPFSKPRACHLLRPPDARGAARAGRLASVQPCPTAAPSPWLIGEKLGVVSRHGWKDRQLWLPATTIAAAGRKP